MKKFILSLVVVIFISNSTAFAQNLFDSRFVLGNSASLKLDHYHNWENWASFVEISPTNKYALVEFGPRFNFPGGSLTLRTGFNISASENGAKYVDQQALVLFCKWKRITFLSVNEIKDITRNKPFHWSANQYYYKHNLKYGRLGAQVEAVWWNKNYKAFTGLSYSFPVSKGNLVIWPGWEIGKGKEILTVEYNVFFK